MKLPIFAKFGIRKDLTIAIIFSPKNSDSFLVKLTLEILRVPYLSQYLEFGHDL
jgi:hypothetical protein